MSVFDEHRADLVRAVFENLGTTATRTGYALAFPARMRRRSAEANGMTYEVMTARIYTTDADLAVGEKITVDARTWEIDGVFEKDALTNTYTLRAI